MLRLYIHLQTHLAQPWRQDDRGATAVEYGLLVGLIAAVIVVAITALGAKLTHLFSSITTAI